MGRSLTPQSWRTSYLACLTQALGQTCCCHKPCCSTRRRVKKSISVYNNDFGKMRLSMRCTTIGGPTAACDLPEVIGYKIPSKSLIFSESGPSNVYIYNATCLTTARQVSCLWFLLCRIYRSPAVFMYNSYNIVLYVCLVRE